MDLVNLILKVKDIYEKGKDRTNPELITSFSRGQHIYPTAKFINPDQV